MGKAKRAHQEERGLAAEADRIHCLTRYPLIALRCPHLATFL